MGDPNDRYEAQRLYSSIVFEVIRQERSSEEAVQVATIAVEGFIKLFNQETK